MTHRESAPGGIVYLVGAGPGDVGLLTLRGAELLESAAVVVYDHLANPALLSRCPAARKIYVGKESSAHTKTQDQINQILVDEGKKGGRIVRLKGGDPFIFGRGGEECQALAAAGVKFEVVPGITASVAAAAYAGIPVTHRDFNTSFTVLTGHDSEDGTGIDWKTIAHLPCMAFYMGVKSLPNICAKLIEHGKDPKTPAAVIQWGTHPTQRVVMATLADLVKKVTQAQIGPPAITIVGGAVSLRPALSWFENRPLFGQTVVVTRSRAQASELAVKLSELGAAVLEAPTIRIEPPADWKLVDDALRRMNQFDWVIFTSVNGVKMAKQRLLETHLDVRAFGAAKIAGVGDSTAEAVRNEFCLRVDLVPKSFTAESLGDELIAQGKVKDSRFLLLRADIARPALSQKLNDHGAATVEDVAIYETHAADALPSELLTALDANKIDWITFASGATARNFVQLLGTDAADRLKSVKLASIGPVTTAALRDLGLEPTVQAETFTLDGLIAAMQKQN